MKNHKVVISMGCFFKWLRHVASTQALAEELTELLDRSCSNPNHSHSEFLGLEVVGLELFVGWHEIGTWLDNLQIARCLPPRSSKLPKALQERILNLPSNYIHLPPLKQLAVGREKWFAGIIAQVQEFTGISEFTIHPDQTSVGAWKRLLALIPEGITISFENLDHNSSDFQTIQEITSLLRAEPRLAWTLDTSHWTSTGRSLNSQEMEELVMRTPPSKIHYSASSSTRSTMSAAEVGSHFPVSQTNCRDYSDFLTKLMAHSIYCPIVLEGAVNVGEFGTIYQEIGQLRRIAEAAQLDSQAKKISVQKAA